MSGSRAERLAQAAYNSTSLWVHEHRPEPSWSVEPIGFGWTAVPLGHPQGDKPDAVQAMYGCTYRCRSLSGSDEVAGVIVGAARIRRGYNDDLDVYIGSSDPWRQGVLDGYARHPSRIHVLHQSQEDWSVVATAVRSAFGTRAQERWVTLPSDLEGGPLFPRWQRLTTAAHEWAKPSPVVAVLMHVAGVGVARNRQKAWAAIEGMISEYEAWSR